ncbi:MAG: type IV secretion system protein [Gallionella sp.]|nr:type IV secretion system protein [Gallionella sp.]
MFSRFRRRKPPTEGRNSWLQAQRNARLFAAVAIAEACGIVFVCVWYVTHPVIKEVPRYVEFTTGGNNFVRVLPANGTVSDNEALVSADMRRYIVARELVNKTDEADRYATVKFMSSNTLFQKFREVAGRKDSPLYQDGLKRNIIIGIDTPIAEGVHQVEFVTEDTIDGRGEPPRRTSWQATIGYEYAVQEIPRNESWRNPRGINVIEYTIRRRS